MKNKYRKVLIFLAVISLLCFSLAEAQETKELSSTDISLIKEIVSLRNDLSEARTIRLEHLTIENQTKAAWIIEELLNRAEQKICGTPKPLIKNEIDWKWYDVPETMVDQAKSFLKTLKEGNDPFEGMFAEPGGYVT